MGQNNKNCFLGACMWLNASWPTLGGLGAAPSLAASPGAAPARTLGGSPGVSGAHVRGAPSTHCGCCGGLGSRSPAAFCPIPLCTPWEHGQALSRWLQQNTFPVPSEVTHRVQPPCCPKELQSRCGTWQVNDHLKTWQRSGRTTTTHRPVALQAVRLQQRLWIGCRNRRHGDVLCWSLQAS